MSSLLGVVWGRVLAAVVDSGSWEGIPLGTVTPSALLGILILAIITGRLVPRRTMDDIIHDRNEWRIAHRISEQSRVELNGMMEELMEHAKTTNTFIRSSLPPSGPPVHYRDISSEERPDG